MRAGLVMRDRVGSVVSFFMNSVVPMIILGVMVKK